MNLQKRESSVRILSVEFNPLTERFFMILTPPQNCKQNPSKDEKMTQIYETMYELSGMDLDLENSIALSDVSERDKTWDIHRACTQDVAQMYAQDPQFKRISERMGSCSAWLQFSFADGFKLQSANFCRVRNCPVCQWRKSLYWKAMMYKTYDRLKAEYPTHRWLFLTLTLENPPIGDLRATLDTMHKAWRKLVKRKEFALVDGWIRTTEVTRDAQRPNTHAHPHYHAILLVKPSYFAKGYVKHMDWVRIWGDCLGVSYLPNVDIRSVKPKNGDDSKLRGVIAETLKYAVKPSDMLGDGSQNAHAWFLEYSKQVHKLRFVASGGTLKNALKDDEKLTNADMVNTSQDDPQSEQERSTDARRLNFTFYPKRRAYVYNPKHNE